LKKSNFLPMSEYDYEVQKKFYCGVDFAFSKKTTANHTSFTVGGVCSRNLIHHVDEHRERLDTLEVVEKFFEIQQRWDVEGFFVPAGKDWLAIESVLRNEMMKRSKWLIIEQVPDNTDKAVKGRVFQKNHKAGACRFDKDADWYPAYESELLSFTGVSEAKSDDQFDSTAILHRGIASGIVVEDDDFIEEEEWEFQRESQGLRSSVQRSVTGY
jgi:hypothetical protein